MTAVQNFLLRPEKAVLLVVDIQEKLLPSMPAGQLDAVISNTAVLIEGCKVLGVPVLAVEQYPKGLGPTAAAVRQALGDILPIQKMAFSCWGEPGFRSALQGLEGRKQVILCGIEAHVCVLQTALDLVMNGYQAFISADGVCSRTLQNWQVSLDLMRQAGAVVGSTEIFLFQMLKAAGTEHFKQISRLVK